MNDLEDRGQHVHHMISDFLHKTETTSPSPRPDWRRGFTLIEMLIFAAILSVVIIAFLGILVVVLQLQTRENAEATVNQESQFLLSTVERLVGSASLVDMPEDLATSTLALRMPNSLYDPTYMYASGTVVYIRQAATGTPQAITSPNVKVTGLSFTRHANPPGHDAVAASFTIAYYINVIPQNISRSLEIGVARASTAIFDASVIPSSTATYDLGITNQIWRSVNNTLYFSGSNVGVGFSAPSQTFEVTGGAIYVSDANQGIILKSPNGTCYKLTVTNNGMLATTTLACTP